VDCMASERSETAWLFVVLHTGVLTSWCEELGRLLLVRHQNSRSAPAAASTVVTSVDCSSSSSQKLVAYVISTTDYTPFTFYIVPLDSDTHTHTHPFNGPLSWTTRVSRYQKGTTTVDFTEARDSEWQWHQLDRVQVCTLLHTDNHISTPLLSFFTGRMPFLTPNQQRQSIEGKFHLTQNVVISNLFIQMKGVRPSVCLSLRPVIRLWARWAGYIDRLLQGRRSAANASSVTLSADIGS